MNIEAGCIKKYSSVLKIPISHQDENFKYGHMKKKRPIFILALVILTAGSLSLYFMQFKKNKANSIHDIYEYSTMEFNNLRYDIAKIKPEKIDSLTFYYKNQNNQKFTDINDLKRQKEKLIFATNGGIFSKTYEPLGLYIENGTTLSSLNADTGEGNFYLQPNGVFYIEKNQANIIETKKYHDAPNVSFAIQSGPLLVINDEINSSFSEDSQNRYIRSGVGRDRNGNVIFAISDQPVTFHEFASFFKEKLNCNNALYVDGAISEMYVPGYRENTKEKFGVMIGIEDNGAPPRSAGWYQLPPPGGAESANPQTSWLKPWYYLADKNNPIKKYNIINEPKYYETRNYYQSNKSRNKLECPAFSKFCSQAKRRSYNFSHWRRRRV